MARVVKCGLIQAACTTPASEDLEKIRQDAIDKHLKLIAEAARKGVQILCMQEILPDLIFAPSNRRDGMEWWKKSLTGRLFNLCVRPQRNTEWRLSFRSMKKN